jgi:hypothetical protein
MTQLNAEIASLEEDEDTDNPIDENTIDDESVEEKIETENIKPTRKLDYSLKTPQERNELVKKIISETPPEQLTNKYLEILSDYIIFAMDKEERKQKKILTDNHMVTVNKRETSFQGLVSKFENGEDGIYNLIANDKNIIFKPKVSITEEDVAEIDALRELREAISDVEEQEKVATGRRKFLLKKQLIEMRQDQYVIKNAYRQPMYANNLIKSFIKLNLDEHITVTENGDVVSDGIISIFNPKHITALLCNYSALKLETRGKFWSDSYYLMEQLDNLIEKTLKYNYPLYYELLLCKIGGKQNIEIQKILEDKFGIKHSVEYISSLWRNKIPKLIAEQAKDDYLVWYYTEVEYGKWKRCSKCGEIKLAHNRFFSKNKTSKDGFYSICKVCRNRKTAEKKNKGDEA